MHTSISSCCITARVVLLSVVALALIAIDSVQAHSTAWPTITRSEHIRNLRHDVLPKGYNDPAPLSKRNLDDETLQRIVRKDDTIRIQFTAYNSTFHLHLEPNLDFIHPEADLGDGITHDQILAFKGVVVENDYHSDRKWDRAARTSKAEKRTVEHMLYEEGVLGWARMVVEHDMDHKGTVILRGAFMVGDETYHVTTQEHYHIQKRSDDAVPLTISPKSNSLIIYRNSDLYQRSHSTRRKRGLDQQEGHTSSCGADFLLPKQEKPLVHEYYYPPNVTATIPLGNGFELGSSSWSGLWKSPLEKRGVEVKGAGPNPVPDGCPANRLVNYMGVAADCTYISKYKGAANARQQIFADFNTASGIYESTFNIQLGIIALNIVPDGCPATPVKGEEWNQDCSQAYSIDQRLSDFSFWRGQGSRPNDGAGLWHLMTQCNTGPVVGIAWTKALCQMKTQQQVTQGKQQYTAGAGVSSVTPNEWMVVAHEIGHNFGAIHDCNQQSCPNAGNQCCPLSNTVCDAGAKYIMNPSESVPTNQFSSCSIKSICSTIKSSAGSCLKPPGTRSTQSSEANICGNGLKEAGEECDCGSPQDCAKDPCCDGKTCKLKDGAVCDDLNDDCCTSCKLRPSGDVCRKAVSECDIQEVCTGSSPTCPPDLHVPNLTPCTGPANQTGLQCANGLCTSRDYQCLQQDRKGINKQCGASTSCDLTCNDPSGSPMSCTQIPGVFFTDGTPCGFGGTCNLGACEYSSGVNGVLDWAKKHLMIVIPIAAFVGLVFLCCIWSCCCGRCRERRRQNKVYGKPQRLGSDGYQYAGHPPPGGHQAYPMVPIAPPAPSYPGGQQQPPAGFTYHSNESNNPDNPFGNHNALNRPNPNGYC
ncbi:Metallo-peptidase family M12-domain-containing protein [Mortierella sp. GBAus27b]|nr:hypothetical protein BGX31_007190 [Mortierella sp. GBA43]KAI8360487.1 Metallo-peptidase family M12-domain-containing protein [Mortierella sp. GBAus27b]